MQKQSFTTASRIQVLMIALVLCGGIFAYFSPVVNASSPVQEATPPPPPPPPPPTATPSLPGSPSVPTPVPVPEMPPMPGGEPWFGPNCEGSATIFGLVVDVDGNPVLDANVTVVSSTQSDTFSPFPGIWCDNTYTDENGAFLISDIADGDWVLHVSPPWQEGPNQLFDAAPISVSLAAGEALQLDEPIQLGYAQAFVQIVFPGTQPEWIEGSVVLDPLDGEDGCPNAMSYGPHAIHTSISGDGVAYFSGKEPGIYCMSAEVYTDMMSETSTIAWSAPAPVMIEIPADAVLLDLGQIQFVAPTKRIVGSVVYESGAGVPNAYIEAWSNNNSPYGGNWLYATTDESGSFEFTVGGGQWELNLNLDSSTGFATDTKRAVTFAADDTDEEAAVEFTIENLPSSIIGRLLSVDGTPISGDDMMGMISVNAHSVEHGFSSSAMPNQDGTFTMPLLAGTYQVSIYLDQYMFPEMLPRMFAPAPFAVEVGEDAIVDLGDIQMSGPQVTARIVGSDGTTQIAAEYNVFSAYDNGDGVATCSTEGPLPVEPRESMPDESMPFYDDFYYGNGYGYVEAGSPLQIGGLAVGDYCLQLNFESGNGSYLPSLETIFSIVDVSALIDLGTLSPAVSNKHLVGQVTKADGSGVEGMSISANRNDGYYHGGWASAVTDADGNFTLDLSAGEWEISIDLYTMYGPAMEEPAMDPMYYDLYLGTSQQWFTEESSKIVSFADDDTEETQSITFAVAQADATITGTLLNPDGSPAIGISGDIYASSDEFGNSWNNSWINPETATFELNVVAGDWQVGYNLYSFWHGENDSDYVGYGEPVTVSVGNGATVQQDFVLVALDATIHGSVLNPDGSPVDYGHVWVNSVDDGAVPTDIYVSRSAEIVNGVFEVKVLSGIEYEIGVDVYDSQYMQPDAQRVTPASDSVTELVMQFVEPDSTIVGTVYISGTTDVAAHAEISAWSLNGQYRYVTADENGAFTLAVQSDTTWYVSAWWYQNNGYMIYHTAGEIEVEIADAGQSALDLTIVPEDYDLPPMVEDTFNSGAASSVALDDGTVISIPAGAVPVDDVDGDDVRMVITPLTTGLPSSYASGVIDYGYDIQLFDNHTGEEITSALNDDIVVTYQYEDDALTDMNADEATIAPTVRSADDSWDAVENFTLNPEKNEIRMTISQASEAAFTARPKREAASVVNAPGTVELPAAQDQLIFMPLVIE